MKNFFFVLLLFFSWQVFAAEPQFFSSREESLEQKRLFPGEVQELLNSEKLLVPVRLSGKKESLQGVKEPELEGSRNSAVEYEQYRNDLASIPFFMARFTVSLYSTKEKSLLESLSGNIFREYPEGGREGEKKKVFFRERVQFEQKSILQKSAILTYRMNFEDDIVWVRSPVNAKVRRDMFSFRSQDIYQYPISIEDLSSWFRKRESYSILDFRKKVFMAPDQLLFSVSSSSKCEQSDSPLSGKKRFVDGLQKDSNYSFPEISFSANPLVVYTVRSKNLFDPYPREQIYLRENGVPVYRVLFNRKGEAVRVLLFFSALSRSENIFPAELPVMILGFDLQQSEQYLVRYQQYQFCSEQSAVVEKELFQPKSLEKL